MVVRMKGRWQNGCYHNGSITGIVHAHTYIPSVFQQAVHLFVADQGCRAMEVGISNGVEL